MRRHRDDDPLDPELKRALGRSHIPGPTRTEVDRVRERLMREARMAGPPPVDAPAGWPRRWLDRFARVRSAVASVGSMAAAHRAAAAAVALVVLLGGSAVAEASGIAPAVRGAFIPRDLPAPLAALLEDRDAPAQDGEQPGGDGNFARDAGGAGAGGDGGSGDAGVAGDDDRDNGARAGERAAGAPDVGDRPAAGDAGGAGGEDRAPPAPTEEGRPARQGQPGNPGEGPPGEPGPQGQPGEPGAAQEAGPPGEPGARDDATRGEAGDGAPLTGNPSRGTPPGGAPPRGPSPRGTLPPGTPLPGTPLAGTASPGDAAGTDGGSPIKLRGVLVHAEAESLTVLVEDGKDGEDGDGARMVTLGLGARPAAVRVPQHGLLTDEPLEPLTLGDLARFEGWRVAVSGTCPDAGVDGVDGVDGVADGGDGDGVGEGEGDADAAGVAGAVETGDCTVVSVIVRGVAGREDAGDGFGRPPVYRPADGPAPGRAEAAGPGAGPAGGVRESESPGEGHPRGFVQPGDAGPPRDAGGDDSGGDDADDGAARGDDADARPGAPGPVWPVPTE